MFKHIIAGLLLALGAMPAAHAAEFEQGTHYTVLEGREASSEPEVLEFFSYACPHCHTFQRYMDHLEESVGESMQVTYIPVSFGRGDFVPAQEMYYVMQAYGKEGELHDDVFRHIHVDHKSIRTVDAAKGFLAQHGIDEEQYEKAASSFATKVRIKRADQLTRDMRISATPTIVVNNRYVVVLEKLGSPDHFVRLVKFLATNP